MRVAGLISGTSVDGIDVAVVDIDDARMEVVAHGTAPYPEDVRRAILGVSNAVTHTAEIGRLNFLLGELFAEAVRETCASAGVGMETMELIGSQGQTIFHEGDAVDYLGRAVACTLQIGEAAVIRQRTGIPVVSNFREADIAAGGEGAPLVPFLDYRLFRSETAGRVALNIGGIANPHGDPGGGGVGRCGCVRHGAGNMAMDALAPPFDRHGEKARAGRVNWALLDELLAILITGQHPPKTAGREQFGAEFLKCGFDRDGGGVDGANDRDGGGAVQGMEEVIVSGGGVHNAYLMESAAGAASAEGGGGGGVRHRQRREGGGAVRAAGVRALAQPAGECAVGDGGERAGGVGEVELMVSAPSVC